MRARVLFSLVGALIVAVALVSASGAATTKAQRTTKINVSTRAAVVHYLRSIHVNPKGAVIQRGARNYAGAQCPGSGWTCAGTRHTVVQIAKRGGQNRFVCRSSRCAVVQFAGVSNGVYIAGRHLASTAAAKKGNTATCIKTTGLGASCSITQSGGGTAIVWEDAGKLTGLTQTALYTASIAQTSGSVENIACVHQSINIDGSTKNTSSSGATVTLEAHQSIIIKQDSASGNNTAENASNPSTGVYQCDPTALSQSQKLTSTATSKGPITQNEDKALSACPDGVSGDNANLCLKIDQNQGISGASGTNTASFDQESTQSAIANTSGTVSQTQSSICPGSCPAPGGLVGTVNQDSTGVSTANATQNETQCEDAATSGLTSCGTADPDYSEAPSSLTQKQYGPVGVGKFRHNHRGRRLSGHLKGLGMATQTGGNSGDMFTITQTSTQDTDQGSGSTQQNFGQADCSTDGNCTATQNTNINGTQSTNTQSGSNINTSTNCTGSSCTSTCNNASCTTFTQSGAQLTAADTEVKEFGYGGMRGFTGNNNVGDGTGSIAVSGITGPVSKALLFWNGPTSSSDLNSNAGVSFAETPITGTNIGTAASNCWGAANSGPYTNSQSYEADVTTLVSAGLTGGSGTFDLANFIKSSGNTVTSDINGVALVVFYNDGNAANWRNVVLWSGNDSNVADENDTPDSWSETLTGVPWPGSGSASLDFIVGDGQNFADGAISVNGTQIVSGGGIFQGASTPAGPADAGGDLWDVKSFSLPPSFLSTLSTGSNTLQVTAPYASDCLSLVAVAANMPASAPPVLQAPIAPVQKQAVSPIGQARTAVSAFGGGGLIRRK